MAYQPNTWADGDVITAEKLNKMEKGIAALSESVGIKSMTQTTTSTTDGGQNVWTATLTDGTSSTFVVRNGSKGSTGPQGATGAAATINGVTTLTLNAGSNINLSQSGSTLTIGAACAPKFELGNIIGDVASYTAFARTSSSNTYENCGATLLVTDCGDFGGSLAGVWLVQLSNRGSTPTMSVTTLQPHNSGTVTFGYYTSGSYFYFGVYNSRYRASGSITVLRNTGVTIQDFGDSTTAPTGWTAVTPRTMATTQYVGDFLADGSIPMTGALQMGGNRVTDVGEPTAETDAARMVEVNKAVEWHSNENILINADFRDPVDTKQGYVVPPDTPYYSDIGLTTQAGTVSAYTTVVNVAGVYGTITVSGTTYYVDWIAAVRGYVGALPTLINHWMSTTLNLITLIRPKYIELINTSNTNNGYFIQLFEPSHEESLLGKTLTASILIDGEVLTGTGKMPQKPSSGNSDCALISNSAFSVMLQTWSANKGRCFVWVNPGQTVRIESIKLELGDTQTLAHQDADGNWVLNDPPNKAKQLALCSQYDPDTGAFKDSLLSTVQDTLSASTLAFRAVCPTNHIITDDVGLPGVYVQRAAQTLNNLLNTTDTSVHPAFMVDGIQVSKLMIGKFQGKASGNRIYSLPGEDPTTSIALDKFEAYCRNKGDGHHCITAAEWAFLALLSKKNGTQPKGNNDRGKDISETLYTAIPTTYDSGGGISRVATGTGPLTWSDTGDITGIWDLNGNIWEWISGLRLVYGELQVIPYNNAASPDCDTSATSSEWRAVNSAATGWDDLFIVPDGNGTTEGSVKLDWVDSHWQWATTITSQENSNRSTLFANITFDIGLSDFCKMYLCVMALAPEEDTGYGSILFSCNNSAEERCAFRGGRHDNGASSGMFSMLFYHPRSHINPTFGGRPAYYE